MQISATFAFSRTPISVIFTRPECALVYVALQERRRNKIAGRFDCTDCGAMVHAWSGAYNYPIWRIYTPVDGTPP
jgi:hypothetical protein